MFVLLICQLTYLKATKLFRSHWGCSPGYSPGPLTWVISPELLTRATDLDCITWATYLGYITQAAHLTHSPGPTRAAYLSYLPCGQPWYRGIRSVPPMFQGVVRPGHGWAHGGHRRRRVCRAMWGLGCPKGPCCASYLGSWLAGAAPRPEVVVSSQ